MLCPYCLKITSTVQCPHCKETLPALYIESTSGIFPKPPVVFSLVGFSGHGKTVFLASLLYTMDQILPAYWQGFFRQGLDADSVRTVQENLLRLRQRELPVATRRNFPRPSLHRLKGVPEFGTRTLLLYDPPGEAFESEAGIERFAGFVSSSTAVIFLVSIEDLQPPAYIDFFRLLETYVLGLKRLGMWKKRQHLVITLTKVDRLVEQFHNRPFLLDYFRSRDMHQLTNLVNYIPNLRRVSLELEGYVANDLGARNLVNFCHDRQQFASVSFCAVSALGSAPEQGRLVAPLDPRRVVDPLLWVLLNS